MNISQVLLFFSYTLVLGFDRFVGAHFSSGFSSSQKRMKRWTVPHKTSDDLYMDPCKAGMYTLLTNPHTYTR